MTALDQMTRPQKAVATMRQVGLGDPKEYGMIAGSWNQATQTYIYCHNDWQLYYNYHNPKSGYWTARNIKMDLCLEFDRGELMDTMMATMDQAASDAGDWLLAGLSPIQLVTPEEYQSPAERYGL